MMSEAVRVREVVCA